MMKNVTNEMASILSMVKGINAKLDGIIKGGAKR